MQDFTLGIVWCSPNQIEFQEEESFVLLVRGDHDLKLSEGDKAAAKVRLSLHVPCNLHGRIAGDELSLWHHFIAANHCACDIKVPIIQALIADKHEDRVWLDVPAVDALFRWLFHNLDSQRVIRYLGRLLDPRLVEPDDGREEVKINRDLLSVGDQSPPHLKDIKGRKIE